MKRTYCLGRVRAVASLYVRRLGAAAILCLAAKAAPAAWQPGLFGGFHTAGAKNYASPPACTNVYADTAAATNWTNSTIASDEPLVNGTTYWSNNRCWRYWGQIRLAAGEVTFGSEIDDNSRLFIDGVPVLDTFNCGQQTKTLQFDEAGWHDFVYMLGNGAGGAGPANSAGLGGGLGFAIRENGATVWDYPADDGSMSRYRHDDGLGFGDTLTVFGDPIGVGEPTPGYGGSGGRETGTVYACSVAIPSPAAPLSAGFRGYGLYEVTNGVRGALLAAADGVPSLAYTHQGQTDLVWIWTNVTYRLDASAQAGGSVSPAYARMPLGGKVAVEATPSAGNAFLRWEGDVPPRDLFNPSIELLGDRPRSVTAVFGPADAGRAVAWTGGGGDGDWLNAANWDVGAVPMALDDVLVGTGSVSATCSVRVASLSISNATLSIAAPGHGHVTVSASGDLSILDGGRLFVAAGRGANPANYALLYGEADQVAVGGAFTIAAGGVFTPVSDVLTGNSVFTTARRFVLEEGGKVDASGRGCGWEPAPFSLPPGATQDNDGYTYAPGCGKNYDNGAAYGADSTSGAGGRAYGFAYAPWLPGSPNGLYNACASSPDGLHFSGWGRGGGSARIHATQGMALAGWIDANGRFRFYGAPSGGGIWLTAPAFAFARSARLTAEGGPCASNYGLNAAGTGGRISLGAGLSDAQISCLATGAPPASLGLETGAPDFVRTSVLGGTSPALTLYGAAMARQRAGTSTFAVNTNAAVLLAISGVGADGAEAVDGSAILPAGAPAVFGAELFKLAADARSHFTATSWSVTNALGEVVAAGAGSTASFVAPPGAGRLWLTWTIPEVEDEIDLAVAGGGAVTVDGAAAQPGVLRAVRGTTLALGAQPAAGSSFGLWRADLPGAHSLDASWAFAVTRPCALEARFAAPPAARNYVGADGGLWEDAANWLPAGVPGLGDAVSIAGKFVTATSDVFAASLSVAANATLAVGGATADVLAQTSAPGSSSGLFVLGDATVSGGLSVGGRGGDAPVAMVVGGDLSLDGGGRLAVYAPAASGFDFATLHDEAAVVDVHGAVTLAGASRIVPDADPVTGAPVRFRAGSVSVAAGAAFDADARGWGWTAFRGEVPYFVRSYWSGNGRVDGTDKPCSFAPGGGGADSQNDRGAGHGGPGDRATPFSGRAYGYPYAPFLPGSCGRYANTGDRGGGAVWIDCAGQFTLLGSIHADGTNGAARTSTSSGGGIWVAARGFASGPAARLSAAGGSTPGSGYGSGGGRISLALATTGAEREALAAGETPETLSFEDAITLLPANVRGGEGSVSSGSNNYRAGDGTASIVRGTALGTTVRITGSPVEAVSGGAVYGTVATDVGQWVRLSASAHGVDPANPRLRYTCAGFVATNAAGAVVAQGGGLSANFLVADETTYFTWLWANPEANVHVDLPAGCGGAVSVGGESHGESFDQWFSPSAGAFEATPSAGREFLYWVGDVPAGRETDNPLSLPGGTPRRIMPVFRLAEPAAARAWQGGAGAWLDPANWSGGNIPGRDDAVTVAGGTCFVTNYAECASLALSGPARLLVGAWQDGDHVGKTVMPAYPAESTRHFAGTGIEAVRLVVRGGLSASGTAEIAVGAQDQPYYPRLDAGDVLLSGAAKLVVVAGALGEGRTFATGSGFVNVAGLLSLEGESVFHPVCDGYTGGPVVTRSDRLVVATNAAVSADNFGYAIRVGRSPQSLGPGRQTDGNTFGIGAGHGGFGAWKCPSNDFLYAPVQPGSCIAPAYIDLPQNSIPGGGVVRLHARSALVAGALTASDTLGDGFRYTAGAGGTVWLTASAALRILPGARFAANGRATTYGGGSGGGRISVGRRILPEELEGLLANGDELPASPTGKPVEAHDAAAFLEAFPGTAVEVLHGGSGSSDGTFVFLDGGMCDGTLFMLR